jgi:hypothetical protein
MFKKEMRMTYPHRLSTIAFSGVIVLMSIAVKAQTIISNETLATTTFVVNETATTAKCSKAGCSDKQSMLKAIPVTCPAALGKTCTFHIMLDAKVEITFGCGGLCDGPGPQASYQFLVDGTVPSPGPVNANGEYLFSRGAFTASEEWSKEFGNLLFERQSHTTSVVATVTNTSSNSHTVDVNLLCKDRVKDGGCRVTAHHSTMRVDVFEP